MTKLLMLSIPSFAILRRLGYLFMIILICVSCNDDDDDDEELLLDKAQLVGTWILGQSSMDCKPLYHACNESACRKVGFYSDGRYTEIMISPTFNLDEPIIKIEKEIGTYEIKGNKLILCRETVCSSYSYQLTDNILSIYVEKEEGDECDYVIKLAKEEN